MPGSISGNPIVVSPLVNTTYTVTATNAAGCTKTATKLVPVLPAPNVNITPTAPLPICGGQSSCLSATGGSSYSWQPGALTGSNICVTPLSTTIYTVTAIGANGCTKTATKTITVNAITADAGVDKTLNCATPSTSIGTVAIAGSTYSWSPATALSATNIAMPTTSALASITYTVTVAGANGCSATDAVLLTVDKTLPTVGATATATTICTGSSTTITGTGASTYSWQPGNLSGTSITVSPISTTTYTVTGTTSNGCSSTSTVTVNVGASCGSELNLRLLIEGYWDGASAMLPVLMNQGQPSLVGQCDSVIVELHSSTSPYALVQSVNAIIWQDGDCDVTFSPLSGSYFIAVKHRNALETWSALPVAFSPGITSYDFTTNAAQAYGSNQIQVGPGVWALYSGDVNSDENIDLLDLGELETGVNNFLFGYFAIDINGDGNVDLLDSPPVEANNNNFIFSSHP